MTVEAPISVLFALVLRPSEDLGDARERAADLARGARLSRFTREDAEDHLFRLYNHVMPQEDQITVARWLASV